MVESDALKLSTMSTAAVADLFPRGRVDSGATCRFPKFVSVVGGVSEFQIFLSVGGVGDQ